MNNNEELPHVYSAVKLYDDYYFLFSTLDKAVEFALHESKTYNHEYVMYKEYLDNIDLCDEEMAHVKNGGVHYK